MILGNNSNKEINHFQNTNFNKNYDFQQQINNNNNNKNIFTEDIKTKQHTNPLNKNDMYDKTPSLLHERLTQGTISLEEFNKQCEKLGKKRRQS